MEQIIKFGISNYLQLCVEAGFSQIQSHMIVSYFSCNLTVFMCEAITFTVDIERYLR